MRKPFDLTFGVGPTKISDVVKADINHALKNNFIEISHRGEEFTAMSKFTITQLRKLLDVPEPYEVFYTYSATDSWEICAKNLVKKEAFCFANGHFSNSFANCLNVWGKTCIVDEVPYGEINNFRDVVIPETSELITLCHNETSTGVSCKLDDIKYLRKTYPDKMLVVDITSSVGCATYNIADADAWYFSIQKGFGLPSGLGVIIVSPAAIKRSKELLESGQSQGFFNFTNMKKRMDDEIFQTISTPNVLAIYLLGIQAERFDKIGYKKMEINTKNRAKFIYDFFDNQPQATPFVKNKNHRSPYTICIKMDKLILKKYQQKALEHGIQLGGGYGKLKGSCMRIANFNAITDNDISRLLTLFS